MMCRTSFARKSRTEEGTMNPRRFFTACLLALGLPSVARATWSIVAVDRSTGRIVIASATCVNNDSTFLRGVQAVIVPGKGIAACQASVDGTHTNQMLVFNELMKGKQLATAQFGFKVSAF